MNLRESNNSTEERIPPEGVAEETGQTDPEIMPFSRQVEEWGDKAHG